MAKIEKTDSGNYTTRVYIGRDKNKKQLFEYITLPTAKECRNAVREIQNQLAEKTHLAKSNMKASAAFDEWFKKNEPRLSVTTIRVYKMYINRYKEFFQNKKLGSILADDIEDFLNILRSGGEIGELKIKKQSGTSLLKQYCILNEILEEYLKRKNPCYDVKAPKKSKSKRTILTLKQFSLIKTKIKGTKEEIPIYLAACCGMRLGEVFGLQWGNINFDEGTIQITQNMVKAGPHEYIIKSPKSISGVREVIAPIEVLKLLKKEKAKITLLEGIPKPDRFVVQGDRPDNLSKRYETLIKNLGLPHTRFHDLRHYRATRMLATGIPDIMISQQLGHADVAQTKQYQHVTQDIVNDVKDKIKTLQ